MGENIYRIFDGVWNLSLVGGYCVLLVILARLLLQKHQNGAPICYGESCLCGCAVRYYRRQESV